MLECSRNYTLVIVVLFYSLHCVSLSSSRLPIGEDSAVIPLKDALDDWQCGLLEHPFLKASGFECHIEAEYSFLLSRIFGAMDDDLSACWDYIDY